MDVFVLFFKKVKSIQKDVCNKNSQLNLPYTCMLLLFFVQPMFELVFLCFLYNHLLSLLCNKGLQ